ncbi:hypothetical protein CDL12_29268 [Handroanthus impetiginosus]|uniref:BHLH domain-containing protein n=1 Tax=Handroanthus impetiginosus TaxID=429701 RepID=A0A2G9FZD6_9LAMI|nr:hypothetical protein CDL12_29268 [Handroanthus impetiginosus]
MFSSETISRDMSRTSSFLLSNPGNQNTNFKPEGGFQKSREFMGSDFFPNQTPQQQSSGLARYRSAPSSFLAALLDSSTENSSSGDESEAIFSALMNGPGDLNQKNRNQMQYMKQEVVVEPEPRPCQNGSGQMGYESAVNRGGGAVVGSYSVGMESHVHLRINNANGNSSNLVRQSSSPAGFFNGFGVLGDLGNYRVHNHAKAYSSSSGMSNHMNFSSSGPSSSSRFMPSIPENGNETIITHNDPENGLLKNVNSSNGREFGVAFPNNSWNDSPFNGMKRNRDGDPKMFSNFNGLESQNGEGRKNAPGLVHHLSLPKTSAEIAEVEKFLQFQPDTVPCQIRAKRGFATHPRSIAERMRRTRISEKMKKLQDLFPNMDKQTSTADMLDLAVEYIKDLQKQVQTLNDTKAKCICPNKNQETS